MTTIEQFTAMRDDVVRYVRGQMTSQGASVSDAIAATSRIYFFKSRDVENLYRCIHSGLDGITISAIVAHDFNGLASGADILPKSRQFEREV